VKKQTHELLKPHLLPSESLLWCGRPRRRTGLAWQDIPLGVVLVVVSTVWAILIARALAEGGARWPLAVTVSIILVVLCRGVLLERLGLKRAAYGVTNERVIIVEPGLRDVAKSIGYYQLHGVLLTGTPEFGTIRCSRDSMAWKNQNRPGRVSHPALFRRIYGAGAVRDLILEQQIQRLGNTPRARMILTEPPIPMSRKPRNDPWILR